MFCANAFWGLMSPVAKIVMVGGVITPLLLSGCRMFGAMVLFWALSFLTKPEHVPHGDLARLFGAALLGVVINQGCFIFGVGLSSPADASIITTSTPLWAMVLAAFFLKEPVTGKKVLGIAFGACGALLLILGSAQNVASAAEGTRHIWGDALVLLAQLSYSLYLVLYKNFVNKYSIVTLMKWMFTYSFVCMLPFCYRDLAAVDWAQLLPETWAGLGYVVVFGTFLSYLLVVVGQRHLRPTVTGMYNYVQPLVSCIVTIVLGLDHFNAAKGVAVVLIFTGVYLVTISRSRAELERYKQTEREKVPEADAER